MNHIPPQLLAIVEVDETEAVACQATGCNHKVFRQVHLVRTADRVHVLGSSCFKKLYRDLDIAKSQPGLTTKAGKRLTEEERRLLQENTAELIRRFEAESQARSVAAAAAFPPRRTPGKPRQPMFADPLAGVDPTVVAEAKRVIAQRHSCDPDQPGWKGLVIGEVEAILWRDLA